MAYAFEQKPVATIKGSLLSDNKISDKTITIPGVTTGTLPVANAQKAINELLAIVGRDSANGIAVAGMTRTITEEAVNNG